MNDRSPDRDPSNARRVLVLEDHLDAAESLQVLLEMSGYVVAIAQDGTTALATAKAFRPDIVLCDIGLPGELDGYAVARALRGDPSLGHVALVSMTGHDDQEHLQEARDAGFDAHVSKPVDLPQLRELLTRLMSR